MTIDPIARKLLPQSLIDELPEPELKGLGLLAREIADSDLFEIDDQYNIHTFHHDVRVTLHVLDCVKRRVATGDRHLACSVEFWDRDICIRTRGNTPATDDCFTFVLMAKTGWPQEIVPYTLFGPMMEVWGRRGEIEKEIKRQAEEDRRAAEEAKKAEEAREAKRQAEIAEIRLAHQRKLAYLRSREKEDWGWILSHFTTEKGRNIPDYY